MPFLDDAVIAEIRPLLEGLPHPVELRVFTGGRAVRPGRDATGHQEETLGLLREVQATSDAVTVTASPLEGDEEARALGIQRAPTILVRRRGGSRGDLRYAGLPSGHEFTVLIQAIRMVAAGDPPDDPLGPLPRPVLLQTFVTPTCPHCPRAVLGAYALALANDDVVAEAIRADEFPVATGRFRVAGVPDTVVDGRADLRVQGAQPREALVEAIRTAAGVGV